MLEDAKLNLKIDNKPLRERIADMLRQSILHGELRPGDSIVENTLADELGVSRAPLREALQILHTEQLIEIIPYHKTTVRVLTRRDIEELYSLRSQLEQFAVRRIIDESRHRETDRLHAIYREMLAAAKAGDPILTSEYDHQFHDTLITMSDHQLLISTWNTVSQRVRQVFALQNRHRDDILAMARSHEIILTALESGDIDEATACIEGHIRAASEFIMSVWPEDIAE